MASNILVTGGAGYIGSHSVLALNQAGYQVTVVDNLSTGFKDSVLSPARFIRVDLSDTTHLGEIFLQGKFDAVMHFAASTSVPESVKNPFGYYSNNVVSTLNLLQAVKKYRVPRFILSSTAAVYGIPKVLPVSEDTPLNPINPYGHTKLVDEWMVQDFARAESWFRYGILRYFNVAGCDPYGRLGQNTSDATHLIKLACQAALGYRPNLLIFGDDYPTPDGTGIRDFIHVSDLANVHLLVLQKLEAGIDSNIYNCGYGNGYSVLEIINTLKEISKTDFSVEATSRRAGDPPEVIADVTKLIDDIGWSPKYNDIKLILKTAFEWERSRSQLISQDDLKCALLEFGIQT